MEGKPPPPPKPESMPAAQPPTSDEKLWALLAHLSMLVFGVFGPLIIWLVKKEDSQFVEDQAKEALNFQLAVLIVTLVSSVTCVLSPLAIVAWVGGIVYSIIAAVESQKGILYRYPYTFRLVN